MHDARDHWLTDTFQIQAARFQPTAINTCFFESLLADDDLTNCRLRSQASGCVDLIALCGYIRQTLSCTHCTKISDPEMYADTHWNLLMLHYAQQILRYLYCSFYI